jgi:hypothetical protein
MKLPTVRFDPQQVTETVKADLWANVQEFDDLPLGHEAEVYETALSSIQRGRDLYILSTHLIQLGVPKKRAFEISRYLNNRATSLMLIENWLKLGIDRANWLYSGAPCRSGRFPTETDRQRDNAHKSANGTSYQISNGMMVNGKWTHPGREPGCKCVALPIIPGFD